LVGFSTPLTSTFPTTLQCINGLLLNAEEFAQLYDGPNTPVVVTKAIQDWKSLEWKFDELVEEYKEINFLVGGSGHLEEKTPIKMKYFWEYVQKHTDENPLFIHDYGFNRRQSTKKLMEGYEKPSFFGKCYLESYLAEARRPPWRHFTIAPKNSGQIPHRNPYRESEWVGLSTGSRLYALFEPDTPKSIFTSTTPLSFFKTQLPSLLSSQSLLAPSDRYEIFTCTLTPGNILFIPSGWHYAWISLTPSMSFGHGMATEANFDAVWRAYRIKDKRLAYLWYEFIERFEMVMVRRLKKVNEKDGCPEWCREYEEMRINKAPLVSFK
jgi:hypothetical protein